MFTLQTLPACDESFDDGFVPVSVSSPHAGVAAQADKRHKLERPRRCISRPAIAAQHLSPTPNEIDSWLISEDSPTATKTGFLNTPEWVRRAIQPLADG